MSARYTGTAVALHVAAALKHLLVNRDGVCARMWPRPAQPAVR